jgi:hypothetical protein
LPRPRRDSIKSLIATNRKYSGETLYDSRANGTLIVHATGSSEFRSAMLVL